MTSAASRLFFITLLNIASLSFVSAPGYAGASEPPEEVSAVEPEADSFEPGESITLEVTYLGMDAGKITVTVEQDTWEERPVYELEMTAVSRGIADMLYPLEDRWVSYLDRRKKVSQGYDYYQDHGGDTDHERFRYDHEGGTVTIDREDTYSIPDGTQDILTAVYYLRTKPFNQGDVYEVPVNVDEDTYRVAVTVGPAEEIYANGESQMAHRLRPAILDDDQEKEVEEQLEEGTSGVEIWVSADEEKLPLRIGLPITFGSIYGYLKEHQPGEEP